VYDLLKRENGVSVQEVITPTKWKGLDLLPSHVDLSGAEIELAEVGGRENRLREALDRGVGAYDFVLLDTPPSLSLLTVNVFAFAREILVACQTHPYSFDALEELFDTIEAIRGEINPDLRIVGILATFFDRRTRVSQHILEKLKRDPRYSKLLFESIIRTNTTIAESAETCAPVVFTRSTCTGSLDYIALARELGTR
jgi:chromosome partitioning protein